MKIIVPPIDSELSFLTGTFLNNYDVSDRKPKPLLTCSTVGKWEKLKENTIVETTHCNWSLILDKTQENIIKRKQL